MANFKAKIHSLNFTLDGLQNLTLTAESDLRGIYDELNGKELLIKIKPYTKRRSLNANNYAWALLNEIANVLRADKEEIYLDMLKKYGQSEIISAKAAINLLNYVKYYEEFGESELNGKLFKHYKVYKGSSEFDTREMSIFIDGIVSEAKALGIQTESAEEIELLKREWK